jgi:NAD(P)-dependent dehydrogenase (short-subunit alcohol dehydrogenase family)
LEEIDLRAANWRQVTPNEFVRRVSVNLEHAFFAIQAVAPGMIAARAGSIVNFGSISWMAAQAGCAKIPRLSRRSKLQQTH